MGGDNIKLWFVDKLNLACAKITAAVSISSMIYPLTTLKMENHLENTPHSYFNVLHK